MVSKASICILVTLMAIVEAVVHDAKTQPRKKHHAHGSSRMDVVVEGILLGGGAAGALGAALGTLGSSDGG